MLKNTLYPYIEKYINKYLYGFIKEQFDIGLNGKIGPENLNQLFIKIKQIKVYKLSNYIFLKYQIKKTII
jgi:hypothetical protein